MTTSRQVKPTLIALVVCDNIYQEPGGKTALVGLFGRIRAHGFPVTHPRMAVYASVTGLRQGSKAKLDIVHAEDDSRVIVSAEGPFPDEVDPLSIVDMNFVLNNVQFPEPGTYYMRFWGNDHLLVMRPFVVEKQQRRRSDDER